ncbi:MAG: hypothetical protein E7595_00465 [Ruminococcaceae bacterium]|nr:hypothetical protein [Oscillospiraceae bacterium]
MLLYKFILRRNRPPLAFWEANMSVLKRSVALLIVAAMLVAFAVSTFVTATAVEPLGHLVQWETKWKSYYYGGRNLYNTGCGIFALVNAVGYLTGKRMSITGVASWAHSIGAFNTPSAGGTYRTALYPRVQAKYGATYGFTVDCGSGNTGYWSTAASSTLKKHLANGGVAVGHVPGHFIALVGYDYATNKFHVYDSAPSSSRGTSTNYGDCWVTQSRLSTGKLDLDWFCLLSATGTPAASQTPAVVWQPGNYELLGVKYLRDTASSNSNTIINIPKGEVMQVYEVVNSNFGRTQYGDYKGYILLDEDTKYIGGYGHTGATITSSDTRLANSGYTATWSDVPGAAGYRFKIIELNGTPDPNNYNESENAKVIRDITTWMDQTVSYTIDPSLLTNGKYLKIAVQTCFPNDVNYWTTKYVACSELPFADVSVDAWYYDEILYSYKKGYITGITTDTFAPNDSATKAQMVTFIHRLAGEPAPKSTVLPYTDVTADAWYIKALTWCYENGIVDSATLFNPAEIVTRETAAVYFYRLADCLGEDTTVNDFYGLLYFNDSDQINEFYYEELAWAVEKSLIQGYDNNLTPKNELTRAQVATLMYNFESYIHAEPVTPDINDTPVG